MIVAANCAHTGSVSGWKRHRWDLAWPPCPPSVEEARGWAATVTVPTDTCTECHTCGAVRVDVDGVTGEWSTPSPAAPSRSSV
jgi:hypothetical protein